MTPHEVRIRKAMADLDPLGPQHRKARALLDILDEERRWSGWARAFAVELASVVHETRHDRSHGYEDCDTDRCRRVRAMLDAEPGS